MGTYVAPRERQDWKPATNEPSAFLYSGAQRDQKDTDETPDTHGGRIEKISADGNLSSLERKIRSVNSQRSLIEALG